MTEGVRTRSKQYAANTTRQPCCELQSRDDEAHTLDAEQKKQASPLCFTPVMMKDAMSTSELQAMCFRPSDCALQTTNNLHRLIPSRFKDQILSDIAAALTPKVDMIGDVSVLSPNRKTIKRLGSRQGRASQRWIIDQTLQRKIRLVTGCIPILTDGRVLIISASRKSSWILPKGGWECDESMEESAVRESYEEAGITGLLGARLTEVLVETRKAKQQRLHNNSGFDADNNCAPADTITAICGGPPSDDSSKLTRMDREFSSSGSDLSHLSDVSIPDKDNPSTFADSMDSSPTKSSVVDVTFDFALPAATALELVGVNSATPLSILSSVQSASSAATLSQPGSSSLRYSHVQMVFYPLYVSEVYDDWPERERLRRAVSIDVAIEMLSSRPEFCRALIEVKEKGLHLLQT